MPSRGGEHNELNIPSGYHVCTNQPGRAKDVLVHNEEAATAGVFGTQGKPTVGRSPFPPYTREHDRRLTACCEGEHLTSGIEPGRRAAGPKIQQRMRYEQDAPEDNR